MKLQNKLFFAGLLFLIALSILVHWQWIIRPGIFTKGDWWYISNEYFRDVLSAPKVLNGFDDFTIGALTPMFAPIFAIGGVLTFFGDAFPTWERIFFLWPIAILGVIPMYYLLYQKYKSVMGAIAGTLIYAFNSYIIARETAHLYIVIAYLFLAPLLFIAVKRLIRKPTVKNGLIFTVTTIVFSIYEIRILYIFTLILISYGIYQFIQNKKLLSWRLINTVLLSCIVIILVQSYWLFPFLFAHSSLGYSTFTSRSLFQSFTTFSHALTLSEYSWTGSGFTDFVTQPVIQLAYGIPIIAFAWIIAKPRKQKSGELWFWTAVACVGIFLAKQANAPFPNAYQWIFEHVPGFQLFRDASKFYLYTAFSYAILIGGTISYLEKRKRLYIIAPMLFIAIIVASNTLPLIQDSVEVLTTAYKISPAYLTFHEIIQKDVAFGRSLWVPSTDRFVSHSQTHPRVSAANILYGEWKPFVQNTQDMYSLFSQPNAKSLLNFGSIAYISTPLDTTNGIYPWYSRTQQDFSSLVRNIPGLFEIASENDGMAIWKNNEAKPHLYIANDVWLVDNDPMNYSGNDEKKSSATIFKKDVLPDQYELFQKSLATKWEAKPFEPENLVFTGTNVQTMVDTPPYTPLTTVDYLSNKDTLAEVFTEQQDQTIFLFIKTQGTKRTIATFPASTATFIAYINGKKFPLMHAKTEEQLIGIARLHQKENQITVYGETQDSNLIENPSFEQGMWGTVGDCNNIDGTSPEINSITASITNDATNGQQSLQLSAGKHIGCVQSRIPRVENATLYTISFDYKHKNGDGAIVKILSDSPTVQPLQTVALEPDTSWSTQSISFLAPQNDQSSFQLYLQQPGSMQDNTHVATSLFDNFNIRAHKYLLEQKFDNNTEDQEAITKPFEQSDLEIQPLHADRLTNSIANGTFEEQTTYTAGDCANVNQKSVTENGIMAEVNKIDGESSLILKAEKQLACINFSIDSIDTAFDYFLSLKYRSIQGASPAIALYPRTDEVSGPQELPKYTDSSWHTFNTIISGSSLTEDTKLILYSSMHSSPSEVAFTDISMVKIPILPERTITNPRPSLPSLHESIKTINPTLHIIRSEPIRTPRLLILSDRYSPGWRLFVRPQGSQNLSRWEKVIGKYQGIEISQASHIMANAFVNGWNIDPEEVGRAIGNNVPPEFVVEYWPQRFMDAGSVVSLSTLLLYGIYVSIRFFIRQKQL